MMLEAPRTEIQKVALILSVARWPGETNKQCVERLIGEDMLPKFEDRELFRFYAKVHPLQ